MNHTAPYDHTSTLARAARGTPLEGVTPQWATSPFSRAALAVACADRISLREPHYSKIAARVLYEEHHEAVGGYTGGLERMWSRGVASGRLVPHGLTSDELVRVNAAIDVARDDLFDYHGLRTLLDRYFLQDEAGVYELPQHWWMRVALGVAPLGYDRVARALELYELYSTFRACSSTPTLFNASTSYPQLSSCFGHTIYDSTSSIMDNMTETAHYSKYSGGDSVSITPVRARLSRIAGTGGKAGGPIPYLKIYNDVLNGFDQGGKRKGSGASYLEPWHANIREFLNLRENGDERERAHDIFPALWIPDLFMRRVREGEHWSLFDPAVVPLLHDLHDSHANGGAFTRAYEDAESRGLAVETLPAEDLWRTILTRAYQHGVYWPCFKDTCNARSMVPRPIHHSNLCFPGHTRVAVADGRDPVTLRELCDVGGAFDVYSAQAAHPDSNAGGNWSPIVRQARAVYTGTSATVRVVLDRGESFECTPDHQLATTTYGHWVEAQHSLGEWLEPYYSIQQGYLHHVVDGSDKSIAYTQLSWRAPEGMSRAELGLDGVPPTTIPLDPVRPIYTPDDSGQTHWTGRRVVQVEVLSEQPCYDVQILEENLTHDEHNFYIVTGGEAGVRSTGVLVHNCTEITLRDDEETSFVCNLGSINLAHRAHLLHRNPAGGFLWNTELERTARAWVRNLDEVITRGVIPHAKGRRFQEQDRAIGLGAMGESLAIHACGILYESKEHVEYSYELWRQISLSAIHESAMLARTLGAYPTFNDSLWARGMLPCDTLQTTRILDAFNLHIDLDTPFATEEELRTLVRGGMRNSALFAIAPTATLSNIINVPQSHELPWDMEYVKENLSGMFKVLAHTAVDNPHGLPTPVAREVDQKWSIWCAAARQVWIDQSQSLNLFYDPNLDFEALGDMIDENYFEAWDCGVKTTYYLYSRASERVPQTLNRAAEKDAESPDEEGAFCELRPGDSGFESCAACQ